MFVRRMGGDSGIIYRIERSGLFLRREMDIPVGKGVVKNLEGLARDDAYSGIA